jgi:hypothetical protein
MICEELCVVQALWIYLMKSLLFVQCARTGASQEPMSMQLVLLAVRGVRGVRVDFVQDCNTTRCDFNTKSTACPAIQV